MSLLETTGLAKRFRERAIFADVSLQLNAGDAVVITGASGSGKTTLLRCLNGLERADAGSVQVGEEQLVAGDAPERFARVAQAIRRRVGFVFQGSNLFSHRTVIDNVMEGPLFVKKTPADQARALATALLDKVGILARAAAYPSELSGGEQQRAAIARALAMKPEILLLDEPTSALDESRVDSLADLLRDIVSGGQAILAVTHDRRFADRIASRRFRMEAGRLNADDAKGY